MAYEYKIGTTLVGLQTLVAQLGMQADPRHTFKEFALSVNTVAAGVKGLGRPQASWHWDFMSLADRNILKTYIQGRSATVYIRTRTDDDTYANFLCTAIWPDEEEKDAGRRLDFTIEFINMVEQV